ncbi:MAG: transglutaminase domain-containing protein [Bacilli bacterium]|nr:transglutaminase domain-containing protein [Bacilli bacterium]
MKDVLNFYLQTSVYTNYEPYQQYFESLTNDIDQLAVLVKDQIIHRSELRQGCLNHNNFSSFPWHRYRCEDDVLMTAPAMTAELFRLNSDGFGNRLLEEKIVVTCRYISVLMASILKAKGIPSRCRAGFSKRNLKRTSAGDHWIVEYWNFTEKRWIRIDVSRIHQVDYYNLFDIPDGIFITAAESWLDVRTTPNHLKDYRRGKKQTLAILAQALFHDFHALMNDEISYRFSPPFISSEEKVESLKEEDLKHLDNLAMLMLHPDDNLTKLKEIFETNIEYRIINSPLVKDEDHLETEEKVKKWS